MATDLKISQTPEVTTLALGDYIPVVIAAGLTNAKIQDTNLKANILASPTTTGDVTITAGASLALKNVLGNSTAFLFNNGGSGTNLLQTASPILFTSDVKISSPTNVATSALTTNATQTLTNKRISPRIISIVTATTITPTIDTCDIYTVTALATNATVAAPTGTPVNGQSFMLRITPDLAVTRTFTWNGIYIFSNPVAPPVGTLANVTPMTIGFIYDSVRSKWDAIAISGAS